MNLCVSTLRFRSSQSGATDTSINSTKRLVWLDAGLRINSGKAAEVHRLLAGQVESGLVCWVLVATCWIGRCEQVAVLFHDGL